MRLGPIFLFFPSCFTAAAVDKRADVVFIVVDDLNDWVRATGGKVAYGKQPYIGAFHGNSRWPRSDHVPKLNAKAPPWDGASLPYDDEETGDYKVSQFAIDKWLAKTEEPVMMATLPTALGTPEVF